MIVTSSVVIYSRTLPEEYEHLDSTDYNVQAGAHPWTPLRPDLVAPKWRPTTSPRRPAGRCRGRVHPERRPSGTPRFALRGLLLGFHDFAARRGPISLLVN